MPPLRIISPLAGGRCVPRSGVRLDCTLGMACPAALLCFSPLPHSGALRFSKRAGALDCEEMVEGAAP